MLRAAILGASGYVGAELLRLLLSHPRVEVAFASSEGSSGEPAAEVLPGLRHHPRAKGLVLRRMADLESVDAAFSCLPNGMLPERLAFIAQKAGVVFNLAGDFRLKDRAELERHYPGSLRCEWPGSERYFVPELCPDPSPSKVVSLPGCMAAATLYALYPLCRHGLIESMVVADVKTGSSGSGKEGSEHPSERAHNFRPHKLHGHRHRPEIVQALKSLAGADVQLQFSTHSLDLPRGVFVTVYTRLKEGVDSLEVKRAYARSYLNAPFVRTLWKNNGRLGLPMLKTVVGTNSVELATSVEGRSCVAVAALDNLVKGAGGQAVQSMNRMWGFAETLGLEGGGLWP